MVSQCSWRRMISICCIIWFTFNFRLKTIRKPSVRHGRCFILRLSHDLYWRVKMVNDFDRMRSDRCIMRQVESVCLFVRLFVSSSVCFHTLFWVDCPFILILDMHMGHDHRFHGIKIQGHSSWSKLMVSVPARPVYRATCWVPSDRWPRRGCRWLLQQYVTIVKSSAAAWPGEACAVAATMGVASDDWQWAWPASSDMTSISVVGSLLVLLLFNALNVRFFHCKLISH